MSEIRVKVNNRNIKYFKTANVAIKYLKNLSPKTPTRTAAPRVHVNKIVRILDNFLNKTTVRNLREAYQTAKNSKSKQNLINMNILRTQMKANRNFIKNGATIITPNIIVSRISEVLLKNPIVKQLKKNLQS